MRYLIFQIPGFPSLIYDIYSKQIHIYPNKLHVGEYMMKEQINIALFIFIDEHPTSQ